LLSLGQRRREEPAQKMLSTPEANALVQTE